MWMKSICFRFSWKTKKMLMHDIVSISTFKKWKKFWVRINDINATSSHFLMLIYLFANHTLKILCKYILSISAFEIFREMVYFTKSIKKSNKSKTHNQKQHHVWRHRVTYWENKGYKTFTLLELFWKFGYCHAHSYTIKKTHTQQTIRSYRLYMANFCLLVTISSLWTEIK